MAVIEIVVGAALATATTLLGTWFGIWLTRRHQQADAAVAEREQRLAQMQQLVIAVGEMMSARTLYRETWLSRTTRLRVLGMAVIEFWSVWRMQGSSRDGAVAAVAPAVRGIELWQRRSVEEAAALAPYAAKVAAAGLPLGMADDPELAAAAQKLMDTALEDENEDKVREAIAGLRAVFYGPAPEPLPPPHPAGSTRELS
jgi:hypothetical protein